MVNRRSRRSRWFVRVVVAVVVLAGALLGWNHLLGNRWIRFYGRIVDMQGRPVAGAQVTMEFGRTRLLFVPVIFYEGNEVYDCVVVPTDAEGRFTVRGWGESVTVKWVQVPDLKWPVSGGDLGRRICFVYSKSAGSNAPAYQPDERQPEVFTIRHEGDPPLPPPPGWKEVYLPRR